MSVNSSLQPGGAQQPFRRLKLVMTNSDSVPQSSEDAHLNTSTFKEEPSRSSSPARPSYSPVTPTLSQSSATVPDVPSSEWIEEPEPLPISLDDNADAIALHATLSLLQMQRQQSLRDIKGLNKLRQEALEDPGTFVEELKSGRLSKPAPSGLSVDLDTDEEAEEEDHGRQDHSRFGKLPVGQNIARCPPIEWSKYRIAGEPLDRLHELQRQHPGISEDTILQGLQPPSHEVLAPYRPFTDKVEAPPTSSETRNYEN